MKDHPVLTNSKPEFKKFKPKLNPNLQSLGAPHVQSFDSMLKYGLKKVKDYMLPVEFDTVAGERIVINISEITIGRPSVPPDCIDVVNREIYPIECRQRHITYSGMCKAELKWSVDGIEKTPIDIELGQVPIMVKSAACNLDEKTPEQLVNKGEHENEWGGYFIIRGNEKIIRMLLMSRRNYPIAVKRTTWKERGQLFTELGVMVRTVRADEQSQTNVLHYLSDGTAKYMFSHMRMLSYIPVFFLLKCLVNYTDEKIYQKVLTGYESDQYFQSAIQNMLRKVHDEGLHTQNECKNYIGELFRSKVQFLPTWYTNIDIANYLFNEKILIHLDNYIDKFNMIVVMIQKLFQCSQDFKIKENVDSIMMQEVQLGGQLYQKIVMDRIELWLDILKKYIQKKCNDGCTLLSPSILNSCIRASGNISRNLQTFLATGNVISRSGLGLMQNTGLVIVAENINRMRYMSHFRSIHRGSYFTTMRTTEARQLLPDAWGFICPVHTPDGTPCGLLNHLTTNCRISDVPDQNLVDKIPKVLIEMGMIPIETNIHDTTIKMYIVLQDGKVLGSIRQDDASHIVDKLRFLKMDGQLPEMMEIALVPDKPKGQFPGLFLFTGPARMMRPVKNLKQNKIEYIGSFEQVYMDIAVDPKEMYKGFTTHLELSKTDFLSNLALLIPMPDYNQSPRNMYQCQMGKQTMGTPCHNFDLQTAQKLYRLQTPATPLFRPVHHDNIDFDDFAMGTNAIVAVISYTGYDMEDAMIINKAAHERGFAHGSIYKSQLVQLTGTSYFARDPNNNELANYLDNDGLPMPGMRLNDKSYLYCYYDSETCKYKPVKNFEKEDAVVDSVKYCGDFKINSNKTVCITIRISRQPTIGDKFASRAGQKGIFSQKYPAEDLPFSETGLIPDIVFNPHGFPSRMTIAMMIETMAGKSAALHGLVHDASPFKFTEKHTAIDYFGKLLQVGGYNYYGTERLYSGVDGREMTADIFFGVVHYQRLRHMVSDKWQVRSTGPVDVITQQPIKGRKRGGGVRFGEMERDGLISHGAAYLLQDRLFHCSDKSTALVCTACGSILGTINVIVKRSDHGLTSSPAICKICNDSKHIGKIEVPYSYKYLITELASVNIHAKFKFASL